MTVNIDQNLTEIEGTFQTTMDPKNKSKSSYFPFAKIDLAQIKKSKNGFILTLKTTVDLDAGTKPEWLNFSGSSGSFSLGFPDGNENELVFLLLYMYDEEEKSGDVDPKMKDVFEKWCKLMRAKEPISINDQKGILGEISCILEAVPTYKRKTIEGWKRSNLRDLEIPGSGTNDAIHIESKTRTPSVSSVTISYKNQLAYCNNQPPVILGVTLVQRSLKGKTLPEWVDFATSEIRKTCTNSSVDFENHEVIRGIIDKRASFKSRINILSTDFYEIEKISNSNQIAELLLPAGADFNTWYLECPPKMKKYSF